MNFITNFVKQVLNQSQKESTEKELNEKIFSTKEFKKEKKSVKSNNISFVEGKNEVDVLEKNEKSFKENGISSIENSRNKEVELAKLTLKDVNDVSNIINNDTEKNKGTELSYDDFTKKEQIKFEKEKFLNDRITKELAGYLWNDTSLDRSLKQMNEIEKDLYQKEEAFTKLSNIKKTKKTEIDFKDETYKNLKIIFFQFIIWIILIVFTLNYVQYHTAEKKFLQSSVDLWTNTFRQIVWKIGGAFKENVDKTYIEKRGNLVSQLVDMEKKVQICLDNTTDANKRKELQKLLLKIQTFRKELASVDYISLDNFIKNYDQYNLYVYSLKKTVDDLNCKK